jgi:hypothetical protein
MVRFVGCANPKAREEGYAGFELSRQDLALACEQIVDKPLLIEHGGGPVGVVESAWVGADGRMMVVGATAEGTARGKFARNLVMDGVLPELSLGATADVDPRALTVTNKRFYELSLVEKGLRHGTVIEQSGQSARPSYKHARVQVLCSRAASRVPMADARPEAAAAAAAAPPAPQAAAAAVEPLLPGPGDPALTTDELMARVAALEKENRSITQERNWMQDKTKRSYNAAFDAATEQFLQALNVEDTQGRDNLIGSLKAMSSEPSLSGPEGNAVMEVVCAASLQNKNRLDQAEHALQELKRLRAGEREAPAAAAAAAAPPSFAAGVDTPGGREHMPPRRVQTAPRQRAPAAPAYKASDGQRKMFAWLSEAPVGQGMEHMQYKGVAGRDFSDTKVGQQY